MKRVLLMAVAAAAAFAGCAEALASATVSAPASVTVAQAAGVNVVTPLVLPTVSTTAISTSAVVTSSAVAPSVVSLAPGTTPPAASTAPTSATSTAATSTTTSSGATTTTSSGAATPATTSGASSSPAPASNATLTIYGQAGDAVSMAVPETFKVIRTGGTETLTVKTNTNSEYNVAQNGVILGSGLNADTLSVNVGGSLALASAGPLTPGPYEGMLVVVVQYN